MGFVLAGIAIVIIGLLLFQRRKQDGRSRRRGMTTSPHIARPAGYGLAPPAAPPGVHHTLPYLAGPGRDTVHMSNDSPDKSAVVARLGTIVFDKGSYDPLIDARS